MISEENRRLLDELATTMHGKALRAFLEEEYEAINSVENCESWDDTIGRKHATKVLKKVFYFLEDKQDKKGGKSQYT